MPPMDAGGTRVVTTFLASSSVHGDLLARAIAIRLFPRDARSWFAAARACYSRITVRVSLQSGFSNDQVEQRAACKTAAEPTRYGPKDTTVAVCSM
jgi:hypothetical protein